jgi:hypothetical protein
VVKVASRGRRIDDRVTLSQTFEPMKSSRAALHLHRRIANPHGIVLPPRGFYGREEIVMADTDRRLQQLVAVLELGNEQKKAAETLLGLAKQIDQLEKVIRALPEPQRTAVMHYWIDPIVRHGTKVESYRRTFAGLSEMIRSSLAQA